jgi:hypothetical protein
MNILNAKQYLLSDLEFITVVLCNKSDGNSVIVPVSGLIDATLLFHELKFLILGLNRLNILCVSGA